MKRSTLHLKIAIGNMAAAGKPHRLQSASDFLAWLSIQHIMLSMRYSNQEAIL